jgi:uncharacterized protein
MPGQYLYRIHPSRPTMLSDGPTPEEGAIIDEHFAYLERLTAQGIVLLAGRTLTIGADSFGIVIFRAASAAAAQDMMAADPAIREGVMQSDLFPFRISLPSSTPLTTDE